MSLTYKFNVENSVDTKVHEGDYMTVDDYHNLAIFDTTGLVALYASGTWFKAEKILKTPCTCNA